MWNRPSVLLWVSVRIQSAPESGRRGLTLGFPVPVFLLFQLTDMAEDMLGFVCLFPGVRRTVRRYSVPEIVSAVKALAKELVFHTGPTDLAEIDVSNNEHRVQVKCLLR